jgi:hypothetical protein
MATELCEEGHADEKQENKCPARNHPRHLAEFSAENLHIINVGSLEADYRAQRYCEDGRSEFPVETV